MLYVYGLFKPCLALEIGVNRLKECGFTGDRLAVVVLDPLYPGRQRILDSMYRDDGMSLMDGIAIFSTVGMLMGVIYGSEAGVGPIALGLAGALAGGSAGCLADLAIRKKRPAGGDAPAGEIVVAVICRSEDEATQAESIMKENMAVALGRAPCA